MTGTFFDVDPVGWKGLVDEDEKQVVEQVSEPEPEPEPELEQELDPVLYFEQALHLVDAWSSYQWAKRLLINATHDETRHKVWFLVEKYFSGNLWQVRDAEQVRSKSVDEALRRFELICSKYGVDPVNRDWLYHHLDGTGDYQRVRRKIKWRIKKGKPAQSLKVL